MKKYSKVLMMTVLWFALSGFTNNTNIGLSATYGVCNDDPSHIELKLSDDYTFTYQDHSRKDLKLNINGTYTKRKNEILLTSSKGITHFHNRWKISKNGQKAKSRKGLSYYTLIKK